MSTRLDPVIVRSALGGVYELRFDALDSLGDQLSDSGLRPRRAFVVTDANVGPLHLPAVTDSLEGGGWAISHHVVPAGEASKSADALATIYDAALAAGLERGDVVFALGGGVVGDLAGFAAATWLRGLPLVHLPTSVLAQCDS